MKRILLAVVVLASLLTACNRAPSPAAEAEELVDKARWTVDAFKQRQAPQSPLFRDLLAKAEGVVIFPGAYRAGFIVGAEFGSGVMLARQPAGGWSPPAFYALGAGSVGLQIGGQVAETIIIVRSQKALQALVKHQGKVGADLGITVGTVGGGMEGAVTTNLGADVVVFSHAAGLYAGGSIEGSVLARRNDYNEAYYGQGATPDAILFDQAFSNPQADPLRRVLAVP
ncbi:MAG: lipid-binding SYLF domain-containing protein [Rhodospirillales bacterium]|jgi:lipid-binding SYLF domain-containing protein|nr:lipid-binding SYLF domain-containing protein [Rhodospirillales bacterium]